MVHWETFSQKLREALLWGPAIPAEQKLRKGDYSGRLGRMIPQTFFHPDHIIPPPKFIAALVEASHQLIAQAGVKGGTGLGEIGVGHLSGDGDAGVQILNLLSCQCLLQSLV